jgi:hypothetical protein
MAAFKRKDSGQVVEALPLIYIMRVAQTTPLALPQWVLSAYKEGRMSFSYEAAFVRQNKDKSDEPVKYPNSHWLIEMPGERLDCMSQAVFDATFEPV